MPYILNVAFQNETGQALAGRLHLPRGAFRGAALICTLCYLFQRHHRGKAILPGPVFCPI